MTSAYAHTLCFLFILTDKLLTKCHLANILNFLLLPIVRAEIEFQGTPEELEEHLEADFSDSRVIATFREFVSDKCIYHTYQHQYQNSPDTELR